jgi:hypothetical protein
MTMPTRERLIEATLHQMQHDLILGDYNPVSDLLMDVPDEVLADYLALQAGEGWNDDPTDDGEDE